MKLKISRCWVLIALSLIGFSLIASDARACQNLAPPTPIELGELGANGSVSIESLSFPVVAPASAPVVAPARLVPIQVEVAELPGVVASSQRLRDELGPEAPVTAVRSSDSLVDSQTLESLLGGQSDSLTSPESLPSSIKLAVVLGVLSLAPAIILMTTCYVRVVVVLTLLRQAFGVQQMPPTQVLTALSLFVTLLVMAPVWQQVKTEAIDPYTRAEQPISWEEAWTRGVEPVKHFMLKQIRIAGNEDSVAVFYQNLPQESVSSVNELPATLEDVPVNIVLPAFLISELKVAFLLGFQIYLPFLILDLVVSSVTVSMGMVMLPPTMVSFPLKLILFVMVDGWNLVLGMLLQSFG